MEMFISYVINKEEQYTDRTVTVKKQNVQRKTTSCFLADCFDLCYYIVVYMENIHIMFILYD